MERDDFLSEALDMETWRYSLSDEFPINFSPPFFGYLKTDVSVESFIAAKRLGMYLAESTVSFEVEVDDCIQNDVSSYNLNNVTLANMSDQLAIEKIAQDNFIFDRFHQDPNFPPEVAARVKRSWIRNFFLGCRGDRCFVFRDDRSTPKGFLLSLKNDDKVVIDLVAVDTSARNSGIGRALVYAMFKHYQANCKRFAVGTQLKNLPSICLYISCGFSMQNKGLVWHYFQR